MLVLQARLIRWGKMDPVYDKWVAPLPLIRPACNYTETIDFKVVPCWPGLNQHDQLDKDEWFSARRAIFSPQLPGDLSKIGPFPPCWSLSPLPPPGGGLFHVNLDQLVRQLCGTNLVEPTKEIRPKLRSSPHKKDHN